MKMMINYDKDDGNKSLFQMWSRKTPDRVL